MRIEMRSERRKKAQTQRRQSTFGAQWLRSGAVVRETPGSSSAQGVNSCPRSVEIIGDLIGKNHGNDKLNDIVPRDGRNISKMTQGIIEEDLTLNVNSNGNFFDSTITTMIDSKRRRPDSTLGNFGGPHPWLPIVDRATPIPVVPGLEHFTVNSLFQVNNRSWDVDVVRDLFSPEDASIILGIPLSSVDADTWYWVAEKNGFYSVRGAYHLLQTLKHPPGLSEPNVSWKILWSLKAPPKAKDLVWRAASNCLATKVNLCIKKVLVENTCPMCGVFAETELHILVSCNFAWACWEFAGLAAANREASSLGQWLNDSFSRLQGELHSRVVMVSWAIWCARNDLIWQQRSRSVKDVVTFANSSLDQWLKAQGKGNIPLLSPLKDGDGSELWLKPSIGIKLNVDAAIFERSSKHGIVIVISDNSKKNLEETVNSKNMLTMVVESDKEKWECTEPRVTVGKLSFVGFSFNDEILFQQVLKRMPWTFKVVLTENNARRLTSLVRQIQVLNWASPTRMLMKREVKVNLFIPIMKLVFVKKHLSVDGKKCWVKFKFNFLPMICYRCGWWGHEEGGCEQEMVVVKEVKGKIVPLYGDWLKTDNPRKGCFDEGGRKYLNVRVVADSHHFANRVVVSNGEQQSVRMGGGIGGSKQLWWEGIGDRGDLEMSDGPIGQVHVMVGQSCEMTQQNLTLGNTTEIGVYSKTLGQHIKVMDKLVMGLASSSGATIINCNLDWTSRNGLWVGFEKCSKDDFAFDIEAAIIVDSCNSRNFIGNVAAKLQIQKESFKIKAQRLGIMSISEGMSRLEKGTGIDDYVISGEFSFA
ncbi:hypothetical protein F8388_014062 [Cannabis sativa]|uniref:Reverse transcriptase zinc-binding domain-containing protein n=1 Tax=Cannabis sativa TaxID=3483 RepID=A0A7J6GKY6_CANSA|nr:hypothetical protein F8388_014062 [Cannabis sativa]